MNKHIEHARKYIPSAAAALLFTALLAQAPHAATVFIRIAPTDVHWEAWGVAILGGVVYAIALESATAYFVWRNKMRWAIAFALFSIMHNVAYYMPGAWTFDIAGAELSLRYIVSALLISASLPIAIAAFSHVHVEAQHTPAAPQDARQTPATAPQHTTPTSTTTTGTAAPHSAPPVATAQPLAAAAPPHGEPDAASDGKRRLTDGEKRTIISMSSNGMKAVDIAAQMQLNENTVRSTIARASKPTMQTNGVNHA